MLLAILTVIFEELHGLLPASCIDEAQWISSAKPWDSMVIFGSKADRQVLGLVVKVDEEAFDAWQHHHHSQRGHTSKILRIHNHNDDLLHMLI